MRTRRTVLPIACCLLVVLLAAPAELPAGDFEAFLKPLVAEHCAHCHGDGEVNGKVDFGEVESVQQMLQRPALIAQMIKAVDANEMPPADEPELAAADRTRLLDSLKALLRQAASGQPPRPAPIRRLNRFQYNNAVRDLFRLKLDLFPLPEKLMTRHSGHLQVAGGRMPDRVEAASLALNPPAGLRGVKAFPKDLRATHGFDNQANQLTLSPLLLDAFLRLSVSIVESPDFNEQNVGIWSEFFKAPAEDADPPAEIRRRLEPFLTLAFRRPVEAQTRDRYAAYAAAKLQQGLPFEQCMKKTASAALSSPMFLYRSGSMAPDQSQFELASKLSFFLWSSGPDLPLLQLAERGALSQPEQLEKTIARMFADPKIGRFLDTFPAQWMQLENVLAATPDPQRHRLFSLDKSRPASLQMVLEPLLLFDAVFLEDRPIVELIAPSFSYRSDFLQDWYGTDLQPPPLDEQKIAQENKARGERRQSLQASITAVQTELTELDKALADPIAAKLTDVDLSAGQAKWETDQAKLVQQSVALSPWRRIGPFKAGNFDEAHAKAFLDVTEVDLNRTYGKLKWQEAKQWVDGKVHPLSGDNSATYLYRTIQSPAARSLELSLGSDDSFKLWLNGRLIADKKITRGVAPDQDKVPVDLAAGENQLLMKVVNGGGGYGFYFKAHATPLPAPVLAALQLTADERTAEQREALARHYRGFAPELGEVRKQIAVQQAAARGSLGKLEEQLKRAPQPQSLQQHRDAAQRRFDDQLRGKLRSRVFHRVAAADPRYGGVITNAAMLSMTSGPKRTHPIARGAWVIEVILNDPPPPPPNDVPPLNEESADKSLTIREKFAVHRANPDCAACHSRLDPLGFALENFDITGRWRDKYDNGRAVDASGTLIRRHNFEGVVQFKQALAKEQRRFAKAFTAHLLRFALSRELRPGDLLTVDVIVDQSAADGLRLRTLIREVVRSDAFLAGARTLRDGAAAHDGSR